jgi:hypothetical protein
MFLEDHHNEGGHPHSHSKWVPLSLRQGKRGMRAVNVLSQLSIRAGLTVIGNQAYEAKCQNIFKEKKPTVKCKQKQDFCIISKYFLPNI